MQGTEGWSRAAIAKAATVLDFSPALAGICKRGGADLVEFFIERCNAALDERIEAEGSDFVAKSMKERALLTIRWRLEMLQPVIGTLTSDSRFTGSSCSAPLNPLAGTQNVWEGTLVVEHTAAVELPPHAQEVLRERCRCGAGSWPQAMAVLAAPEHIPLALSLMHSTIDRIWRASGDEARSQGDIQSYSQRMALQVIYTSTELHMMADFSPEHADTWAALEQRLEGAFAVEQGLKSMETSLLEIGNRLRMFGGRSP